MPVAGGSRSNLPLLTVLQGARVLPSPGVERNGKSVAPRVRIFSWSCRASAGSPACTLPGPRARETRLPAGAAREEAGPPAPPSRRRSESTAADEGSAPRSGPETRLGLTRTRPADGRSRTCPRLAEGWAVGQGPRVLRGAQALEARPLHGDDCGRVETEMLDQAQRDLHLQRLQPARIRRAGEGLLLRSGEGAAGQGGAGPAGAGGWPDQEVRGGPGQGMCQACWPVVVGLAGAARGEAPPLGCWRNPSPSCRRSFFGEQLLGGVELTAAVRRRVTAAESLPFR